MEAPHPASSPFPPIPPSSVSAVPSSSHQLAPTPPSEGWRGEAPPPSPQSTPSFVTELRSRLNRCFGGKEPDLFGPLYAAIVALASECTEAERRSLRELLPHLHPFTSLISDKERQALITTQYLDATHVGLKSYHLVEKKLQAARRQASTPALQKALKTLQEHYQSRLEELIKSQDRRAFLRPKAQLWYQGFFLIDRALAKELLSCDEKGKISRLNRHGSRPVVQYDGMHLKIGAEGFPELDPASEAAVSSLCHLLSPKQMTAAPTSVFYIRVPGKCEALVQASLTVGGERTLPSAIPLNELLDTFNSFDLLKQHFGSFTSLQDNWEKLMKWAKQKPAERTPSEVLRDYLLWMKTVSSTNRCKEFMEPEDLIERERPDSFFSRNSWQSQLSQFHDTLRSSSATAWAKLLELLKLEPGLMKSRSIQSLLRLHRSLGWLSKLLPNASFKQIARELPILLDKVDRDALSRLFVASLIVNPHDGKADNYMVAIDWKHQQISSLTIIGIDNDLAFKPPVLKSGETHRMATKCLLYALPPRLLQVPIPESVRHHLCQEPPEELILRWIAQLDRNDQLYSKMAKAGLTAQDLSLKLPKEALAIAIRKLRRIQKLLEKEVTLAELFQEVEPVVFYAYSEACHRSNNGKDALALLGWKRGLALEELLQTTFTTVHLNGESISLQKAYQKMARAEGKRFPLHTTTQAALHHLSLKSPLLTSLTKLSFVDQLKIPLKSPQKLLVRAIQTLNLSLARLALLNGAKPRECNTAGYSPLAHLIPFPIGDHKRGAQMLRILVESGADLEWKDPHSGETLLDFSARDRLIREFVALISCGAGRTVQAGPALTFALSSLQSPGMKEALKMLEARSPQIGWLQDLPAMLIDREEPGSLPLHRACLKAPASRKGKEKAHSTGIEIVKTYLHPAVAKQIGITAEKRFPPKPIHQYGRHTTKSIEHQSRQMTFKDRPEMAGNEFLVGSLHRRLVGHGTPETELFKAYDQFGKPYPILASQTVPGPNFRDTLHAPDASVKLGQLDRNRLHNMILMAILTDPEDGKPENYIFSPMGGRNYQLFCIDNDHSFVRPFDGKQLMVKCVLFCLDQMEQPIDSKTRERFLALNPDETLKSWLNECSNQNRLYTTLFSEPERGSQFNASERDPILIQMFLPPRTTAKIYEKIGRIQEALQEEDITPLKLLLYANPVLGRYYQQLFTSRYKTPQQRWQQVKKAGGYLTDASGGDLTRTSTLDLLKHFGIAPQKLLSLKPAYFIDQAQAELIRLRMEKNDIAAVTADLPKGRTEGFRRLLLDHSREKVLQGYTFGQSSERDRKILEAMVEAKASLQRLAFGRKGAFSFGSAFDQLQRVLFHSPSLRSLTLDRCNDVTGKFFWNLASLCPHLVDLSLMECSNLKDVWGLIRWLTFPSLERLNLKGSKLQRFLLGAPHLTSLDLSDCAELKRVSLDLPALKIGKLDGCTSLSLNELKDIALKAKCGRITAAGCPPLKRLKRWPLAERHLPFILHPVDTFEEGLIQALNGLLLNRSQSLTLRLDDNAFQALTRALPHNSTLLTLDLLGKWVSGGPKHPIGADAVQGLAKALSHHPSLSTLTIREHVRIHSQALAEMLQNNTSLLSLQLPQHDIGDEGAVAFARPLSNNIPLTSLDLAENKIGPMGAEAIARGLAQNSHISTLQLGGNSIGDQGTESLARALRQNSSLSELRISSNSIGFLGAEELAQALHQNSTLETLYVFSNKIEDQGARAFAQALRVNSSLETLFLCSNRISHRGVEALAEPLKQNSSLLKLSLYNNPIGDQGAEILAKVLEQNSSLRWLIVPTKIQSGYYGMSHKGLATLAKALKHNHSLTRLKFGPKPLGGWKKNAKFDPVRATISKLLKRNRERAEEQSSQPRLASTSSSVSPSATSIGNREKRAEKGIPTTFS